MKTLFFLIVAVYLPAISQWSQPRVVDSTLSFTNTSNGSFKIAVGPQRQVAIVASRSDTLRCYISNDNARTFARSVAAIVIPRDSFTLLRRSLGDVMGVAFDDAANCYVLYREAIEYDFVTWVPTHLVRSTDGGRSFSRLLSPGSIDATFNRPIRNTPFLHRNQSLTFVTDSSASNRRELMFHRVSPANPSSRIRTPLPQIESTRRPAFADLMDEAPHVSVAYSSIKALVFTQSADSGRTFSELIAVDTIGARRPEVFRRRNGSLAMAYFVTKRGVPSGRDSALVVADWNGSGFNEGRTLVLDSVDVESETEALAHSGASLFLARTLFSSLRVEFLEFDDRGFGVRDSLFLFGHHSPSFALDSLGGKYLLTIFNNRLYLTTKDVVVHAAEEPPLPNHFVLEQNYPNPFNSTTIIKFQIPNSNGQLGFGASDLVFVSLKVFDLLGKEVATLLDAPLKSGTYDVQWNPDNLPTGVYFYTLATQGVRMTRKMLMMK